MIIIPTSKPDETPKELPNTKPIPRFSLKNMEPIINPAIFPKVTPKIIDIAMIVVFVSFRRE